MGRQIPSMVDPRLITNVEGDRHALKSALRAAMRDVIARGEDPRKVDMRGARGEHIWKRLLRDLSCAGDNGRVQAPSFWRWLIGAVYGLATGRAPRRLVRVDTATSTQTPVCQQAYGLNSTESPGGRVTQRSKPMNESQGKAQSPTFHPYHTMRSTEKGGSGVPKGGK